MSLDKNPQYLCVIGLLAQYSQAWAGTTQWLILGHVPVSREQGESSLAFLVGSHSREFLQKYEGGLKINVWYAQKLGSFNLLSQLLVQ